MEDTLLEYLNLLCQHGHTRCHGDTQVPQSNIRIRVHVHVYISLANSPFLIQGNTLSSS